MRVTISGKAGSGKSTVAKLLAKRLNIKHFSIGDLMRLMANERGLSLLALNKLAEKDKPIDFELDERLKELGRTKNDFVVDGRLTAFFIPHAEVRVFLDADYRVRAERILKDKRKQEHNTTLKETARNIRAREKSEEKRYKEYYNASYFDKKLYNIVIDTTKLAPSEVVDSIMRLIKKINF